MAITQDNKLIAVETPLGKDALLLTGVSGREAISMPFEFELTMISENHNIVFKQVIGKSATVGIVLPDGKTRFINGLISRFSQGKGGGEEGGDPRFSHYRAALVPWLWLLTQTADSRIFQESSVPEIVEQIFTEKNFMDFKMILHGTHDKRTYCVQYRETDFNFISRLLEEEGIYYYFEHENGKHTLILTDIPNENNCPHQKIARYLISAGSSTEVNMISSLEVTQEIHPSKYSLGDFNFEMPNTDLNVEAPGKKPLGPGVLEIYDYPGEYDKREKGERLAAIRIEEEEVEVTTLAGTSTCRAFVSGYNFILRDYYREDMNEKPYVLTSVEHEITQSYFPGEEDLEAMYSNSFICIPLSVPFRPPRNTPKPVISGTQTAIVVGPSGEEIHTDDYGRVKVQFHWDREGQRDDKSSCWIRVSQNWAGPEWGAVFIPRIGQEVIVDFLEGDPDRPIIVGRVYNGVNMPPYKLPDEKTKSTIKSNSSIGGEGFNEIRFEDKKDKEQIFIHAQRNQDTRVKNDSLEWIGYDRHLVVKNEQFEMVESDKHLTVKGDQNEKVNGTISQDASMDIQQKVGMKHALDAGMEIHLKAGMNVVIEAGMSITLQAGGGFIVVGPTGVTLSGIPILINSGGSPVTGSGCSPGPPKEPKEAASAKPGKKPSLKPPKPPVAQTTFTLPPQALTLKRAAERGSPFCEKCAEAARSGTT